MKKFKITAPYGRAYWQKGWGRVRRQRIHPQECLALYKSFNTLWEYSIWSLGPNRCRKTLIEEIRSSWGQEMLDVYALCKGKNRYRKKRKLNKGMVWLLSCCSKVKTQSYWRRLCLRFYFFGFSLCQLGHERSFNNWRKVFFIFQSLEGKKNCLFWKRAAREESMDQITIKTPNPKCRLYWWVIEFVDWRYS